MEEAFLTGVIELTLHYSFFFKLLSKLYNTVTTLLYCFLCSRVKHPTLNLNLLILLFFLSCQYASWLIAATELVANVETSEGSMEQLPLAYVIKRV